MFNVHRPEQETHKLNVLRSVLRRMQVAKEKGDTELLALLEQEYLQLKKG
jgi:hypothetical protein